ncbi:MAG: glycosyltransferase family 87 protein [Alphaproteobacteria bacterium]
MSVRSQRASWFDYVVLSAAIAGIAFIVAYFEGVHSAVRNDFALSWTVSDLLWQGKLGDIYDPPRFAALYYALFGENSGVPFWPYPPIALFLVAPVALLPSFLSYLAWSIVTLALFAASVRSFFGDNRRVLMLALAPSSCANIILGQTGFVTAALLVGGLAMMDRRPLVAGLLFGLLAFKPQLGIMLPLALAAARLWKPFVAAALTALAAAAASVAAFGIEAWRSYFAVMLPFELSFSEHDTSPLILKAPTVSEATRLVGAPTSFAYLLQAVAVLAAGAAVVWAFRRMRERSAQAAVLLAGTALACPHLHVYDMSIVSVASVVLAETARAEASGFAERLTITLAWVAPIAIIALFALHILQVPHDPYVLAASAPLIRPR